ncbi:MAG: hypothetical protein AAF447_16025, partial [Myxococcota bacterium]
IVLKSIAREARRAEAGAKGLGRVPAPDGLAAWRIRADFVAQRVEDPTIRKRLGKTLRPPRGRQRFARALACHPEAKRAFSTFERDALETYLTRWLADGAGG